MVLITKRLSVLRSGQNLGERQTARVGWPHKVIEASSLHRTIFVEGFMLFTGGLVAIYQTNYAVDCDLRSGGTGSGVESSCLLDVSTVQISFIGQFHRLI